MEPQGQNQRVNPNSVQVEPHIQDPLVDYLKQEHQGEDNAEIEPEEEDVERQELFNYQLARDRQIRDIRHHIRYRFNNMVDYSLYIANEIKKRELGSFQEAVSCVDSKRWLYAIKEEMNSLSKNKTWRFVEKPKRQKLIDCKWIYKLKEGATAMEELR